MICNFQIKLNDEQYFDLIFYTLLEISNSIWSQIEICIVFWGCNSRTKHKEQVVNKTHLHVIYQESFPDIFCYVHNQSNKIQVLLHILARTRVYNCQRDFDINRTKIFINQYLINIQLM